MNRLILQVETDDFRWRYNTRLSIAIEDFEKGFDISRNGNDGKIMIIP